MMHMKYTKSVLCLFVLLVLRLESIDRKLAMQRYMFTLRSYVKVTVKVTAATCDVLA